MTINEGSASASTSAGIDHAVGVPIGPSLKNPTAISTAGMSVKSMKLAEFWAWGRSGVDDTMSVLPMRAEKEVGAVANWPLAALEVTVNDPPDDAITDQKFWDWIQKPNGGHFRANSVVQAPGAVIDVPASKVGEMSGSVSDALQALDHWMGRGGRTTTRSTRRPSVTAVDAGWHRTESDPVSNVATVIVLPASWQHAGWHRSCGGPVSNGAMVIAAGATLELASAYSGTVAFAGATGTLKIDNSSSFSGTIAGQLAIGNVIDLADITAGANATITYSGNNSPGTLTVSDGTHTANIALYGQLFAGKLYSN